MAWRGRTVLLTTGAVAGLLYSNFLLDALVSPGHDWFEVVSELEMPGRRTATLLRVTDVVCALLVIGLAVVLASARRAGWWERVASLCLTVFALGAIAAAVVPMPCRPGTTCTAPGQGLQERVHDTVSLVSEIAIFLSAGAIALGLGRYAGLPELRWLRRYARATFWIGGVVATVFFVGIGRIHPGSWQAGLSQRVQIVWMSGWIYCFALVAAQARRPRDLLLPPQPEVSRALG